MKEGFAMIELSAPAASIEGVNAAIQGGADSVYINLSRSKNRKNNYGMDISDFIEAAEKCRICGVKIYVCIFGFDSDENFSRLAANCSEVYRYGADAVILSDIGAAKTVKQTIPELPVFASAKMGLHNLEGLLLAKECGISRAALPETLSREDVFYLCRRSPIEIQLSCHGELCPAFPGTCSRKESGEGCSQFCLKELSFGKRPLALLCSDICLADCFSDVEKCAPACISIEGIDRSAEFIAAAAHLYSSAIKDFSDIEWSKQLAVPLSLRGVSGGFFKGEETYCKEEKPVSLLDISKIRDAYMHSVPRRVPVDFIFTLQGGKPSMLSADDRNGHRARVTGSLPEFAQGEGMSREKLVPILHNTVGTPYLTQNISASIASGFTLSEAEVTVMKIAVLDKLTELRKPLDRHQNAQYRQGLRHLNQNEPPLTSISVEQKHQISKKLAELKPDRLYVPASVLISDITCIYPFWDNEHTQISAVLPPIVLESERGEVTKILKKLQEYHLNNLVLGSLGGLSEMLDMGFSIRGDWNLACRNSQTIKILRDIGFEGVTASPELTFSKIKTLSKIIDTELIAYGRIPLMVTGSGVLKGNEGNALYDKLGADYPVFDCGYGRSTVFDSRKLFLAKRSRDYQHLGLNSIRLMFTSENPKECISVVERYLKMGNYEPGNTTYGSYYGRNQFFPFKIR